MEQSVSALDGLKESVQQLMNAYSLLKTQNDELNLVVSSLDQELVTKQSEIDVLSDQYKVLKMAKSLEGVSTENKDVKLKINEMVREIDKCIALLNK